MKLYKGKLIEKIIRTPSIVSFRFVLEENFSFIPGQFIKVLFNSKDQTDKELNKYLSLSSSPLRDYVEVTKRISNSKFSEKLKNIQLNDELFFSEPMGKCVLGDSHKKVAFLVGGIGITPVISIIEYATEKKTDNNFELFYSNRVPEEIAFKSELEEWKKINPNLKICYTLTDCEPRDNICIYGFINRQLLTCHTIDFTDREVFIFGPPKMVDTMKNLCLDLKCDENKIHTEKFMGY